MAMTITAAVKMTKGIAAVTTRRRRTTTKAAAAAEIATSPIVVRHL